MGLSLQIKNLSQSLSTHLEIRKAKKMFYLHRVAFVILLAFSLWFGACGTAESTSQRSNLPEIKKAISSYQEINIESIWEHPDEFKDQKVLVQGSYLGWRGQVEHPHVSRSDWALQDETGAIYITGLPAKGLDPVQDIGRLLEVFGTVELNAKAVPYIRAESVILKEVE